MSGGSGGLRIALLTYRGNPHSGGQGVYTRYLSRALVAEGHEVTVFAGPPYPELDDGVTLVEVPSLDLYRPEDPFRRPARHEFRDWIDYLEYGVMCAAGFPEPLTFSLRAARQLRDRARDFDVVHDNQCLGYGLLDIARRIPVVATVHHPVSIDRRLEIANARGRKRRMALRRWYSFVRMQGRVARRLPRLVAVSDATRSDLVTEFGVDASRVAVVHNGVDAHLFRPLPHVEKVPGQILTTASADVPLKGLIFLIEALAKLRTEMEAHLVVVGKAARKGTVREAIERFGLQEAVEFRNGIDWLTLVELYATAEVAVVPSLYEGFSLPAAEAMSCGVPVIASTAGALPEVVGRTGECALLVPAGDAESLRAALATLFTDPLLRARMGAKGRARVERLFSWRATASRTVDEYRRVIDERSC